MHINFHPFPVLLTERLQLRALTPDDAPEIFIQRSDPRIVKYTAIPPGQTPEDARNFIEKIQANVANGSSAYWAIALQSDPLLVGTICLWNFSPENNSVEIGYSLHPDVQGKGYMQEALEAVGQFAFNTIGVSRIEAYVHPENTTSIRLMQRNNFVHTGESEGLMVFVKTTAAQYPDESV